VPNKQYKQHRTYSNERDKGNPGQYSGRQAHTGSITDTALLNACSVQMGPARFNSLLLVAGKKNLLSLNSLVAENQLAPNVRGRRSIRPDFHHFGWCWVEGGVG
jgi:hypothetical protein